MAGVPLRFFCLDPRKSKRAAIARTLGPLGDIGWLRVVPMRRAGYPETARRAAEALAASKTNSGSRFFIAAKTALLRLQYNGARAFFEARRDAVAVAWNGLNGSRRVFMDGARDAGARRLYFELSPFPDRITVDPCGVNYHNGLPRDADAYVAWAKADGGDDKGWRAMRDRIRARPAARPRMQAAPGVPLDRPFVFIPLQVPGDSQLRLFGGAFRTVETVIKAVADAARDLPDGWHARIKEHPSSPVDFTQLLSQVGHPKLVVDNVTDTFTQVAAARAVVTVNSSVGLEAMFFDKPVVALGQCFWAIPGIADHCDSPDALRDVFARVAALGFDADRRAAFLSYLTQVYYPDLSRDGADGALHPDETSKVRDRLAGPTAQGFWHCGETI